MWYSYIACWIFLTTFLTHFRKTGTIQIIDLISILIVSIFWLPILIYNSIKNIFGGANNE